MSNMFCFQCQEAAKGTGCTLKGVCGKNDTTARAMDLLLFTVRGISIVATELRKNGKQPCDKLNTFVTDALFSTITNANFDDDSIYTRVDEGFIKRNKLIGKALEMGISLPEIDELKWTGTREQYDEKAAKVGVMRETNEDIRSLKELIVYGLKGMAAYLEHANRLGYNDVSLHAFIQSTLATITVDNLSTEELTTLALKTGEMGVQTMALLDTANTSSYGHPEITSVSIGVRNNPGILISGHDLHDLEQLLEQTKDRGVDVYTHGEMLPAHAYPELKKYPHLKGNFGTAWQNQQKEFADIPAPVLFTTNCLMPPKTSYADRVFTTEVVSYPQLTHIGDNKDFTPVIKKALSLGGYPTDMHFTGINGGKEVVTGFSHNAVLSAADTIIDAVKSGTIRHFFLVGGCDGAKPGRNYYTDFVKQTPADTVVLTLACGKYRFNDLDLGTIGGLPRMMDMGQCNDAYSAIKVAVSLAEAFHCGVNDLPLSMVLSWYEQKAVCILLTLLHLGIKNILLGPSLPVFISPNVLNFLVKNYNIAPISTPEDDLKKILG